MRILLTGASSFTGFWFARQLSAAGHEVTATFTGALDEYSGVRRQRVDMLADCCRRVWQASFGGEVFLRLLSEKGGWDVLCCHGAWVRDYKSDAFPVLHAIEENTRNLPRVLTDFSGNGGKKVVLTGSVFEQDEGSGSEPLMAFSPYGLSKGLTAEVFKFWCRRLRIPLGKFVIPNPFGPFEEPRFTWYLVSTWAQGKTPSVKTPAYVRDNIHISLLAKAYADFVSWEVRPGDWVKSRPSGYPESQGAFARRTAEEMRPRLGFPCELHLEHQTEFPEPPVRINTDIPDPSHLKWGEAAAWDELAEYYRRALAL